MYILIVDSKETFVAPSELHQKTFLLKCQDVAFTIKYPSGYTGVFTPPIQCVCKSRHNSIEVSSNKCNNCNKKIYV